MSNQNKSSSLSIVAAVVFILLLVALAIYSGNQRSDKKSNQPSNKTAQPENQTDYNLQSNGSITIGPADAKVTFVEYYDYQCPACQYLDKTTMPSLIKQYQDRVKFVFRQFPLSQHNMAKTAAYAAVCANDQGKFLDYNNLLVAKYDDWVKNASLLENYAKQLDLDLNKFNTCRHSKQVANFVSRDISSGMKDQLEATPTVFINGEKNEGAQELSYYQQKIDKLLK